MESIIKQISDFLWGAPMLVVLVSSGLYFTFSLKFIQIRKFIEAWKITLGFYNNVKQKGEISHLQALSTALSATIGTGNIVGVATAIALGGPGALFWMWITAILGMSLKFTSCTLSLKYRIISKKGEVAGGPMYYLDKGLGFRGLAIFFAICTAITATFIGNMIQANSLASCLEDWLSFPKIFTGVIMGFLVWLVIVGGVVRIARVAEVIVPFMCGAYLLGGVIFIFINLDKVIPSLGLIFKYAFSPTSAMGGFAGSSVLYTIRMGVARGIFSNEAGLGSAPIAHAAAKEEEPVREGLVAMLGPFIDTLVICTITGLVIIISGLWKTSLNGAVLTSAAFSSSLPYGKVIVNVALMLFAFSTTISWFYYGERALFYCFGKKENIIYRWIYSLLIPLGAVFNLTLIWNIADIANGFMIIPNLIGLWGLRRVVLNLSREYENKRNSLSGN